eukprot:6210634-Pleurochrysis_carterae.AAC.4
MEPRTFFPSPPELLFLSSSAARGDCIALAGMLPPPRPAFARLLSSHLTSDFQIDISPRIADIQLLQCHCIVFRTCLFQLVPHHHESHYRRDTYRDTILLTHIISRLGHRLARRRGAGCRQPGLGVRCRDAAAGGGRDAKIRKRHCLDENYEVSNARSLNCAVVAKSLSLPTSTTLLDRNT